MLPQLRPLLTRITFYGRAVTDKSATAHTTGSGGRSRCRSPLRTSLGARSACEVLARWTRGSECTRARLARGSHAPHPTRLGSQLQRHCPDWNVPRAWTARACASCGARMPARRRRAPTPIFCDAMHEPPRHKGAPRARPRGHGRRGRRFGGYRLELQTNGSGQVVEGVPHGIRRRESHAPLRRHPAQPTHAHGVMRHGTPLAWYGPVLGRAHPPHPGPQ